MGKFESVTELPKDIVPREQLQRIIQRYSWAKSFVSLEKDVLEIACGPGIGSKCLDEFSKSYYGIDIDEELINFAKHNNPKINFSVSNIDKDRILKNKKFDLIIFFEAIYYIDDINKFFEKIENLLKDGGQLLICSANKNLKDFNKSQFSKSYYDAKDISEILNNKSLKITESFGGYSIDRAGLRQFILRPIKIIAAKLNLIPKSMENKLFLKKLFYGNRMVEIPNSIEPDPDFFKSLVKLNIDQRNTKYKVLYFVIEKTKMST